MFVQIVPLAPTAVPIQMYWTGAVLLPVTYNEPVRCTEFVVLSNPKLPEPDVVPLSLNCMLVFGPAGAAVAVIPVNCEPLPWYEPENDPEIPNVAIIEPVTTRLPVIMAEPVYGKALPPPPGMIIDAVLETTFTDTPAPVKSRYSAVPCVIPSSAIVTPEAPPAFKANEAVKAYEELVAIEDVVA